MTAGAIAVPTIVPLRAPLPGQHKTCIDTNTKIELSSETNGTTIYYTTNGDKPDPFQTIGPASKNTYKYKGPFRLPSGKRTVKAVAIASDGIRESHVCTKTFEVEQAEQDFIEPQDDGLNFVDDLPKNTGLRNEVGKYKLMTSKQAWAEVQKMRETEEMMRDMSMIGSAKRGLNTGPRHLNQRLNHASSAVTVGQDTVANTTDLYMNGDLGRSRRLMPDTATQAMRLQRETDFLKCIYCFADRPSDPYARFCNECGNPVPPLPQQRIAPPEPGQMGMCVHCKSMVPFNTNTCVVCEAPMHPQNQPQASVRLAEKLVCTTCRTANPANLTSCVTCGERLPVHARPIHPHESAPPLTKKDGRMLTCSKCSRVNNADARFCDWCGSKFPDKPTPANTTLICSKCQASNHPYAAYCAGCGVHLAPPQRQDLSGVTLSSDMNRTGSANWLPLSLPLNQMTPKCTVATQTVGLFYPSQKDIEKQRHAEEVKLETERQIRDRNPPLTAISPGRGYWRKQMDHIASHLKAHAQNNTEFRALIGEPRMGKIISTAVHEDGYELSLTVNFALRGTKDPFTGKELGFSRNNLLSSYTEGRRSMLSRYGSEDSLLSGRSTSRNTARSTGRRSKKKVVKKVKKHRDEDSEKLTPEDRKLLKEVAKAGEGRGSEVQQLIDEGADPNCVNKDGYPVLQIAVQNKHVDAIPVLVQEGAKMEAKGPNRGNNALHEAVLLGHTGLETIDTLLALGVNCEKKNDRGETAYDLAVKNGYETIATRLTSNLAQNTLGKLSKPRTATIDVV